MFTVRWRRQSVLFIIRTEPSLNCLSKIVSSSTSAGWRNYANFWTAVLKEFSWFRDARRSFFGDTPVVTYRVMWSISGNIIGWKRKRNIIYDFPSDQRGKTFKKPVLTEIELRFVVTTVANVDQSTGFTGGFTTSCCDGETRLQQWDEEPLGSFGLPVSSWSQEARD